MKNFRLGTVGLALLCAALAFGCNRSSPPPEPLASAELPGAIQKAFADAKPEIKTTADQILVLVQAQDYSKAFLAAQNLASKPGLTKEQVSTISRATLTLNNLMQEAQSKGDTQAARTLQNYSRDK